MATQQLGSSSTNPGRSRPNSLRATQTTIDARIHADFEKSGTSFDYSTSVQFTNIPSAQIQHGSDMATTATYLQQIQKAKLIQPFGCLLALDEKTFKVIAYSENAPEMLTMVSHAVPTVGDHPRLGIGSDIRTIFTAPSAASLQKALGFGEVSLLNPVLVHCKTSGKPFYAIIHRVTGSLIIDFEPVKPYEVPITASGALQSYKLAAKAIARLQALPCGSLERLCETMAQAVFELTGYDRVMVYRFHDDDHGEVFAEITRPGLESYAGLHYPATDIPQAARYLFMKSKVRMICDCRAAHVKVVQDERLSSSLTLCGSTMRAPHSCHLRYMENMNSIASLVMAVVINEVTDEQPSPSDHPDKKKRLWGLVVCHHTSPRFVPFPLRYACEFLSQVFSIHVSKELDILNQAVEKNILKTQTVLCDMLLRGNPLAIVAQNPTVMDLVKCDGAVLLYKGHNHRLGLAPTDPQIRDIVLWLDEYHRDSTGTSTDSLLDAGFPGAAALGDAFCGMAAVRVTSRDWQFWFRSNTAAEVRWGGAKHEKGEEDDGRRMHPRSSFKAFMEVVKARSVPWKDFEMDAIHSLQLILRNACEKEEERKDVVVVGEIQSKLNELDIDGAREMDAMTAEMVRLIETASVPILAVGVDGVVNGWNTKIADLTGLPVDEAIGQHMLALVEEASADAVSRMLESVLQGQEERNIHFEIKTHGPRAESGPISLVVNGRATRDVNHIIIGVCFIAQDVTTERSITDRFTRIEGNYLAIVQNPNPLIPPIFGSDEFGWCSEWNPAMAHLTGWQREEVTDKMLLGEVFGLGKACCRLKNQESYLNLGILLNKAVTGQDSGKLPFGFFSRDGKYVDCLLSVSKRVDREGAVTGLFCFLQLPSRELQQALHVQRVSEQTAMKRLRVMNYIRCEIKNPLSGIVFSRKLMEGTELDDEQKKLLRTTLHCQRQLNKILDDTDLDHIIEGYLDLEMAEFKVTEVLIAAVSQIMEKSNAKGIVIADELAPGLDEEILYGDSVRLQQVLAAFLLVSVDSTPGGGHLGVAATLRKDSIGESVQLGHLEFRITHSGVGVPQAVIDQMFGDEPGMCKEGLSLFINRKLVKLMNGNVQYLREADRSTFTITVELAVSKKKAS